MSTLDTAEQDRSSRTAAEWLWPLLPIGASVFCLSALFYFHVNHGAVNPTSPLQRGIAGIYRTFGLAPAVMFFFMAGTWSTIWFVTGKLERPLVRIGRLLAMAVMLGVFLNLGEGGVTAAVHKGELGAWLAGTLVSTIGYFPSIVMVWAVTFASLLLATDFFFSDSFERMRTKAAPPEVGVETAVTDHLRGLQSALHENSELPRTIAPPLVLDDSTEPLAAWSSPRGEAVENDAPLARDAAAIDMAAIDTAAMDTAENEVREGDGLANDAVESTRHAFRSGEAAPLDAAGDATADAPARVEPVSRRDESAQDLGIPAETVGARDDRSEPVIAIPRPDAAPRPPVTPVDDHAGRQQSLFAGAGVDDALLAEAMELIRGSRRVTATLLQRRLRIDYAEALDVLAALAARGQVELEADASQGRVLV